MGEAVREEGERRTCSRRAQAQGACGKPTPKFNERGLREAAQHGSRREEASGREAPDSPVEPMPDSFSSLTETLASPVKKLIEDAAAGREADAQSYKEEFQHWAAELEERATLYFTAELNMAAVVREEESREQEALCMALRSEHAEVGGAMRQRMEEASHDIRQRAKRKVVIARKKCQLELKKLRVEEANEAATAEAQEQEASMEEVLREKLRQAEQALLQAEEQEEEQLKLVRMASGEEELAQMASQLEEEAARKVGELGEAYRSQEELLAKREHQSSIAQRSAAMNKAWRQRLEDAEAAAAKARAQLQVASEAESRLQCTQLQLELGESWPAGLSGSAGSSECLGDFSEVDAQELTASSGKLSGRWAAQSQAPYMRQLQARSTEVSPICPWSTQLPWKASRLMAGVQCTPLMTRRHGRSCTGQQWKDVWMFVIGSWLHALILCARTSVAGLPSTARMKLASRRLPCDFVARSWRRCPPERRRSR
ncbi:unnamed protein product [Effrenium voratum]|nr:unnamed protein product [Effrenium voratum]